MITRIVKMSFEASKIDDFKTLFDSYKSSIRNSLGCEYLELLQDEMDPTIFFTYSKWQDPSFLELYRKSELFEKVWATTKAMFKDKPNAWTCSSQIV